MKNLLLTLICCVLFCGISLQPREIQAQAAPPKTKSPSKFYRGSQKHSPQTYSTDIAELIFKRVDSNHDGSISLKEFKAALPRLRQSFTRESSSTRGSSQERARGFDGRTPSFRPSEGGTHLKGDYPSRGRSHRDSKGRSRGSK
jgi:hypothetical protein